MTEQKKTEEQIRHDIRRAFSFSEERDKERIDKAVEMEKDRFKAVQKKVELSKQLGSVNKEPEGDKKEPVGDKEPVGGQLSVKDSAFLLQNNVPVDDWDEVAEYAKYKGISIKEAYSSSVIKAALAEKAEERKSSEAIDTGKKKRGSSKVDGDKLLEKASQTGEIPDDDASIEAMAEARYRPKPRD